MNFSGKKILVVEDNESSHFYFDVALKKNNAKTIWAKNGKEAVDLIKTNQDIDLVLMDLNMPVMDGFDATREIKKINPRVPVIVQSAFIVSGEKRRSFEAGCDEFLEKPILLDLLLNSIAKYLA